jgi:uncharacterized SAM-binding protein YcdF (DUF218 family)
MGVKWGKRWLMIAALVVALAVVGFNYEYLLTKAGNFLVVEEPVLTPSDMIVVLNGRDTERLLAAADLFHQGHAAVVGMVALEKQAGTDEFRKRVGPDWNSKVFAQRALEALGIPETAFTWIGNGAGSTFEEARAVEQFAKAKGYRSIIVVTSKWHSKRTRSVFASVFRHEDVHIAVWPTKYDTFDPTAWWKSEGRVQLVIEEYVKLAYYVLTFRIRPIF